VRVDAEVVPVEDHIEVVESETEGGVLGFMPAAGGVAPFALDAEHLHFTDASAFERHRLTDADRRAVTARSGVELHEEMLTLHLDVTG